MQRLITPNWPAPKNIHAYTTTRLNGHSLAPFNSFNFGMYVGDDSNNVKRNREKLITELALPAAPLWLKQTHSSEAVLADSALPEAIADAAFTFKPNIVCAVTTADCLPLLVTDSNGTSVAAIHAGWRGLAAGIIEATIKKLNLSSGQLLAWLGPAIGAAVYAVSDDVYQAFVAHDQQARHAFKRNADKRWLMDIYLLAKQRLFAQGVEQIFGGDYCTYSNQELFFSYRREQQTGRMATVIWFT